jgi:hypothetical protein
MMAVEEATSSGAAVAAQEDDPASSALAQLPGAEKDEGVEYEFEFATPFGNIEFEFEPQSTRDRKAAERKVQAERRAAKKAAEAARRAAARQQKSGRGGRLLIVLLVIAIVGAAIIVAYWLFARPEETDDGVPAEFANEPQPAPQGFVARARKRVEDAVRAGRKASRDAQREEREKYERLTS